MLFRILYTTTLFKHPFTIQNKDILKNTCIFLIKNIKTVLNVFHIKFLQKYFNLTKL